MTIKMLRFLICITIFGAGAGRASAVTYFSDTFNTDTSGSWTQNKAPTANAANQQATWLFDHSTFGIPAAPGNAANDTLGLRLRADIPIVGGVEVVFRKR